MGSLDEPIWIMIQDWLWLTYIYIIDIRLLFLSEHSLVCSRHEKALSQLLKKKKKKRPARSTPIQFFLLNKSVERTPKASELILIQAGLGWRTVAIPEDADHSEVCHFKFYILYKAVVPKHVPGGPPQHFTFCMSPLFDAPVWFKESCKKCGGGASSNIVQNHWCKGTHLKLLFIYLKADVVTFK